MRRTLFRYRSFNTEKLNDYSYIHQRIINIEKWKFEAFEGLVYPSSPLYFNDPYDCEFCFQSDALEGVLDRETYIHLLERRFSLKQEEKNRILYSDNIERAMQIVLQAHGGRDVVITLVNSFHGRTIATLTATGQEVFHNYFGPFNEGFQYVPAGDIEALQELVDRHTCAVMMELIQGEGGVMALDPDYVQAVRALCDEKDLVLIVDEVQTGVGRTGTFLCCEHYNLKPDIVTLAKGLGGGLPIGAVLMNEKVAEGMGPGTHGSTFGGNPVVCAGANVVVDRLDQSFLAQVSERAVQLRTGLAKLPHVKNISGIGLMVGIEFFDVQAADVLAACREKGLLVLTAKTRLRLLPPLTVSEHEVDMALEVLAEVLGTMEPTAPKEQA